ncbi:hypothetical protein [Nonomuraea typhae]|uniref:Helix-turn-helix domain-containing protein n=1 Tax=Nonomuraea typhae TaxID=2603600 RepID=A0ABW7YJ36_9ACTN
MAEAVQHAPADVRAVNLLTLWALADNCLDDFRICQISLRYLADLVNESPACVRQSLWWLRHRGIIEFPSGQDEPEWERGGQNVSVRITESTSWAAR